jgi:methyl-accepting chemotaxis protein/methyl-accepting chemotaxis protein-1 (serine sensor receptor)
MNHENEEDGARKKMNGWSIGKKLYAGVASMLVLLIVSGVVAVATTSQMQGDMQQVTEVISRRMELAAAMATLAEESWAGEKSVIAGAFARDRQRTESYRDQEKQALNKLTGTVSQLKPLLESGVNQQDAAKIESDVEAWQQAAQQVYSLCDRAQPGKAQSQSRAATEPLYKDTLQLTEAIRARVATQAVEQRDAGNASALSGRWWIVALLLISILVGLVMVWVVRGIVGTVRGTVADLSNGGEQVAAASSQIASSSQNLSQGASEQAASLEQVSASMEEMTAMTKRNAENSAEATAMMSETVAQVGRSNTALNEMVASMDAIKVSSEKIARINKTIDEIAFQTNILALNAAVEAARAGVAGMGFAVVADEVRSLAQRSAVAAKDTAALIEEAIANSNQGAAKLEQVATAIRGITDSANKVKGLVDEVNEASRQQTGGIAEATKAILEASHVTQSAAASAEESAAAAEQLSAQSQTVSDLVHTLRAMVDGASDDGLIRSRRRELLPPAEPASKANPSSKAKPGPKTLAGVGAAPSQRRLKSNAKSNDEVFPMGIGGGGSFRNF